MNIIKSLTYQEKRSTFLALLLKLDSQKEAEDVLKELQLEHKDARHILRALRESRISMVSTSQKRVMTKSQSPP